MSRENEIRHIEERETLLDKEIQERQKLKEAYRLVREDLARHGSNGAKPRIDTSSSALPFTFPPADNESDEREFRK